MSFESPFFKFFQTPKYIYFVYLLCATFSALIKFIRGPLAYNNYLIYKHVFINAIQQNNLYKEYSLSYFDVNHYGIFFTIIIAPFSFLPDGFGMVLWNVFNAFIFIYAVNQLAFSSTYKAYIAWFCLQEFITASLSFQYNIALAGFFILSAQYINDKKEFQSVFCILLGTFVKLYGIVGLSQFFFVSNKKKFLWFFLLLGVLFFCFPMTFSGIQFTFDSYHDWMHSLVNKNQSNHDLGNYQDISLMGFYRRIFQNPHIPNYCFFAFGIPLFLVPYLRVSQYRFLAFRYMILAHSMIFLVLFSSSSESPTYIIAVTGVMIWYWMKIDRAPIDKFLVLMVLLLTCFSMSDFFPRKLKDEWIIKYSLKAFPCILVWIKILIETCTLSFSKGYRV